VICADSSSRKTAGIIVLLAVRKPIIFGAHHADGLEDRIMAVEPFVDQALRDSTCRQRFISERDLGEAFHSARSRQPDRALTSGTP
jgi:hypothetical protein